MSSVARPGLRLNPIPYARRADDGASGRCCLSQWQVPIEPNVKQRAFHLVQQVDYARPIRRRQILVGYYCVDEVSDLTQVTRFGVCPQRNLGAMALKNFICELERNPARLREACEYSIGSLLMSNLQPHQRVVYLVVMPRVGPVPRHTPERFHQCFNISCLHAQRRQCDEDAGALLRRVQQLH